VISWLQFVTQPKIVRKIQCSPQILAQQVGDNSWPVFFKTSYIILVNLQKVAGGKKFLELLLEAVNFIGYRLIWRTLKIMFGYY